jgi:hypothetical protein
MSLRDEARGEECTVRLPGVCNFNPETSVLAHGRLSGISGTGLKSPDWYGAIACSACHDEIDGRTRVLERDFVKLAFYEGMVRTLKRWTERGLLAW